MNDKSTPTSLYSKAGLLTGSSGIAVMSASSSRLCMYLGTFLLGLLSSTGCTMTGCANGCTELDAVVARW